MFASIAPTTMPRVGVVIPSHGADARLRAAVESVRQQTYDDWRLVVVDDVSPVPQRQFIDDILAKDGRIQMVRLEERRGAAGARNIAIAELDEELVAFLDADDQWKPTKLEQQLGYMKDAPQRLDLCTTGYLYVGWDGSRCTQQSYRFPRDGKSYHRLVYGCDLSPGSTLIARRELFQRFGGFDEQLTRFEDWDWLMRCLLGGAELRVAPYVSTTVNSWQWPSYNDVTTSARVLARRYLPQLVRRSPLAALRFGSSLLLERAVAAMRHNRRATAAICGMGSLATWPLRNRMFYVQAIGKFLGPRSLRATNGPQRLVHVITGLGKGGAEASLIRLTRELEDRGIEQYAVSLRAGGGNEEAIRAILGQRYLSLGLESLGGAPKALWMLSRHLRRIRPTVVQSWMYHADLIALCALWLSGRRRDTQIYWGIRCSDLEYARYGSTLRAVVDVCRMLSPLPDGIIANSHAGLMSHIKDGFANTQWMLVDNAVPPAAFDRSPAVRAKTRRALGIVPDAHVVAIVARRDPMKGYDMFVEVVRQLPQTTAIAVGAGTETLEELPNLLRLGERNDVPELLAAVDVVVSTSRYGEGSSNAILEAMAAGKPVIATDVGDAARILDHGDQVVARGDVAAMVAAVERLAADPRLAGEWGRANRDRVARDFTVAAMADRFLAIYSLGAS